LTSSSQSAPARYGCAECKAVFRTGFARCPIDGSALQSLLADPLEGSTFTDRYVIEELVGEGAMGRVYRARHQRVSRQFAIKVLFGDHTTDSKMRDRFAREAEAASRLHHPNVISVLDFGEHDSLLYLVMDFVEGPELDALIRQQAPLATERVENILWQLCLGLDHAHSEGLVHRDFKGANVIVAERNDEESPRIVDFGLAVMSEVVEADRITTEGIIFGTPAYMSPEQATGQEIDHLTDLFALGVVLYEMLAGVGPFEGSPIELARQNINADPPPVAERVPGLEVDPTLEAIALRLMSKKPGDRFQSAAEVIDALDDDRSVWPVPVETASTLAETEASDAIAPEPSGELDEPPEQRRPIAGFIIAGLVALTVLGGAGALMIRTFTEEPTPEPEPEPIATADRQVDAAPTPTPAVDASAPVLAPIDAAPVRRPAAKPDAAAKPARPVTRPDPKPPTNTEPITRASLTRLYNEVNRLIRAYTAEHGDAAARPLWRAYERIQIQDAIQKPEMGAETMRALRALRKRTRTPPGGPS
jgi:serine/threonine-protein kinase